MKKSYDQAIADYTRAIELDPTKPGYFYSRDVSHHNRKQYDQALADKSRAIELTVSNPEYFYSRSITYAQMGHKPEEGGDLERAAALGHEKAIEKLKTLE